MLWHPKTLQNLAMYNVFFIFDRFSIAGKLPKWPKIPFQYPLALRHPKILEKCRKHHRILVSVRNRFWAPPAKADIATAILTNVIEHLVLLFCPPISTPSPPKRCGRISGQWIIIIYPEIYIYIYIYPGLPGLPTFPAGLRAQDLRSFVALGRFFAMALLRRGPLGG